MKLPSTIKVGYMTYRVIEWDPREAKGADRYGEVCHLSRTIKIDTSYGPIQSAETLLHEILHAVCKTQTVYDEDDEERTVRSLSRGLTAVWLDNPGLLECLSVAIHGRKAA